MSAVSEAGRHAERLAMLVPSGLLRGMDGAARLDLVPTDGPAHPFDALSDGEQNLLRIAAAVAEIGTACLWVDGRLQAEVGRALCELGGFLVSTAEVPSGQ